LHPSSLSQTLTRSQINNSSEILLYIDDILRGIYHIYREEFANDIILDAKVSFIVFEWDVHGKEAWFTSLVTCYRARMNGTFFNTSGPNKALLLFLKKNKGNKDGPYRITQKKDKKKKRKKRRSKGTIDRIGTKSFTFSVKEFISSHNFIL